MDDSLHAAPAAFRQRFRDLVTQFQQNHRAWQEAVRVGNVPLQSAFVTRERAMLTAVQEVRVYCCNAACQWSGVVSQMMHPQHHPTYWLCPECGEVSVERERMDDIVHAARAAFQQRFQALAIQFRENHAQWQEAARMHDRPGQSALIVREGAILTEAQEVMTAYQALIAHRPE
jgi:predicted RNA-binding Zn-ribbon protein involved in translation (DUF1610 family)